LRLLSPIKLKRLLCAAGFTVALFLPAYAADPIAPVSEAALREVRISSSEALLGTWITDRAGLETYAGDALPVTDDQPQIEYADWVRRDELQRVLPQFIELHTDPPLRGADDSLAKSVAAERQILLTFYKASLNAMVGHQELWARDMQRVREGDSENAYYRWFGGDSK
jgi:spermidine synthase